MNLHELELPQLKHVLSKIEELQKSDGWEMLKQIMAAEREAFFRKMANPQASIVPEIIHYQRGIIEGTYRMADLPDKLIAELQGRVQLAQATLNASQPLPPNTTTTGNP